MGKVILIFAGGILLTASAFAWLNHKMPFHGTYAYVAVKTTGDTEYINDTFLRKELDVGYFSIKEEMNAANRCTTITIYSDLKRAGDKIEAGKEESWVENDCPQFKNDAKSVINFKYPHKFYFQKQGKILYWTRPYWGRSEKYVSVE